MVKKPIAAGKSSFDRVDADRVFQELGLKPDTRFADLGCGVGKYSMKAAEYIDERGHIYGVDAWQEGIAALQEELEVRRLIQIEASVSDIGISIPLEDESIDIGFMATVLHDLAQVGKASGALSGTARILKASGLLGIVEFKKQDGQPGPPKAIRLSPQELDDLIVPFGFKRAKTVELGEHLYLNIYAKR